MGKNENTRKLGIFLPHRASIAKNPIFSSSTHGRTASISKSLSRPVLSLSAFLHFGLSHGCVRDREEDRKKMEEKEKGRGNRVLEQGRGSSVRAWEERRGKKKK
jgi:hypothetical protein